MRIAVPINNDDENIFWHFGHCQRFKLYDINDGEAASTGYIRVAGDHGPLRMQAMIENHVDIILCDGIGPGMAQAAFENGKQVVAGVNGDADDVVQKYLAGKIEGNPNGIHPCGQD